MTDIKSATVRTVNADSEAVDAAYQLYTITLKSGKVIEVKNYGNGTRDMNYKAFTDAGYRGDVAALITFANTSSSVTRFGITDVKSVTSKNVDPIPMALDDEYTLYIITLKSGKVVEVKNYGFAPAEMNNKAFIDAGYTGNISTLKQMVVVMPSPVNPGVVRGASISDLKAALDEILSQALKLQAAVASLK